VKPSTRQAKTITLPFTSPEDYIAMIPDTEKFREELLSIFEKHPELFPPDFEGRFHFVGTIESKKLGITQRKIRLLANNETYQVRPSFIMPYMTGLTEDFERALYLRSWGVPFHALTYCFGGYDMFWYRAFTSLGRNNVVGTTIKSEESLPEHLTGDEKHVKYFGVKGYIATTAGNGAMLGASFQYGASEDDLIEGYGVFAKELSLLAPEFTPKTVNTDGWGATQKAFAALFPGITIILCFLHSWISIRDRCKKAKALLNSIGDRVWDAYRAKTKRLFSQRIRRLREWAEKELSEGIVKEKVLKLCSKRAEFSKAYDFEGARRTSNEVDRMMDFQKRQIKSMRGLCGFEDSTDRFFRAVCLLWNFRPHASDSEDEAPRSVFEKINGFQYHENWLQNLLCAASLKGERPLHKKR